MSETERLYTLREATERFLPPGFSAKALRTEAKNGRLMLTRIAGKDCVTESAIRGMIELCRASRSRPASTSGGAKVEIQSGPFSDSDLKKAQDAAKETLKALKESSRASSRKGTSRRKKPTGSNVYSLPTS